MILTKTDKSLPGLPGGELLTCFSLGQNSGITVQILRKRFSLVLHDEPRMRKTDHLPTKAVLTIPLQEVFRILAFAKKYHRVQINAERELFCRVSSMKGLVASSNSGSS